MAFTRTLLSASDVNLSGSGDDVCDGCVYCSLVGYVAAEKTCPSYAGYGVTANLLVDIERHDSRTLSRKTLCYTQADALRCTRHNGHLILKSHRRLHRISQTSCDCIATQRTASGDGTADHLDLVQC